MLLTDFLGLYMQSMLVCTCTFHYSRALSGDSFSCTHTHSLAGPNCSTTQPPPPVQLAPPIHHVSNHMTMEFPVLVCDCPKGWHLRCNPWRFYLRGVQGEQGHTATEVVKTWRRSSRGNCKFPATRRWLPCCFVIVVNARMTYLC